MVSDLGINASFSHLAPPPGDLAFVTQSGAMVTTMLDWAAPRGLGFSTIVSLCDRPDVDFGHLLAYLAIDAVTPPILPSAPSISPPPHLLSPPRLSPPPHPALV